MASCSADANYQWANNAQGMDPCTVASRLESVCGSVPALAPLNKGQSYPVPTAQDQTPCSCSSVVYNLVSACADCQHGHFGSWKDWSARCTNPAVDYYPRNAPDGVSIPNWAYFDVGTITTYDPAFAKANSPSPPVTATTVQPATTQGQATTTSTSNGNIPSIPNSTSDPSSSTATATVTSTSSNTSSNTSGGSDSTTGTDGSTITTTGRPAASGSQTVISGNAAFSSDGLTLTGSGTPTATSGQTSDNTVSGSKKSKGGIIAAEVIGVLLFLVIAGAILYGWILRRRRRRVAPSTAYIAAYGPVHTETSLSSRAFGDRSTSVLNITQTNRGSPVPYRDKEEYRGNALSTPTSQPHGSEASRASSRDHYHMH